MPFAVTWMDLEIVILSEVSQREKEKHHMISLYVESKKKWYKWTYLQNRNRLTDLENKLVVTGGKGGGKVREFGINMYTLLYLKWITNKDLLYSTGNSAQCHVAAWMGEQFGREWIHVYVWLSRFAVHWNYHNIVNQLYSRDFPGGPVVKTPRSQCREPGFNPRSGN